MTKGTAKQSKDKGGKGIMYVGGEAIRLGGSTRLSKQGGAYKRKGEIDNRMG